jgi:hypothetical protein
MAARLYEGIEATLLGRGLLRRDGGRSISFDAATLARNFERIALYSEYTRIGDRYVARESRSPLRRWDEPVRVRVHFGESVDPETRVDDLLRIRSYLDRLARLTSHPISLVAEGGNYHVFVVDVDELSELVPVIAAVEPGLSLATLREITALDRNTFCAVYASSAADRPDAYVSAVAIVRAEHPDLMRLSCYHEEIAQGLGLANDSPLARPSIFNDDEEFALLTAQDELMLRMLYDPRLRVGMTAEEARPIIARISAELRPDPGPV